MANQPAQTQSNTMNFDQYVSLIEKFDSQYKDNISEEKYFGFPIAPVLDVERRLLAGQDVVAYFSMEFGIAPSIYNSFQLARPISDKNQFFTHQVFSNYWLCDYLFKIQIDKMLDIPIYGGGLGVLAGDTMKSASDLGFPVAGIGILWNKGYFKQNFWYKHGQVPEELKWDPTTYPGLIPLKNRVVIDTNEGPLHLRLWKYYVYSYNHAYACPIILLDSNLPENSDKFKKLTDQLYRSDDVWWKFLQRVILGVGGIKALRSLGYKVQHYHLNEGHAAMAIIERYIESGATISMDEFRKNFMYTCHTPVAAGHDRFNVNDVSRIMTEPYAKVCIEFGKEDAHAQQINLTYICLNNCDHVNAVAAKHGEITRLQFPAFASKVESITNGIHLHTWLSDNFRQLFDRYAHILGDWRKTPDNLLKVEQLKSDENFRRDIFSAHQANKRNFLKVVHNWQLDENVLTVGWARRIAGYKRPGLIFHDIQRIIKLAYEVGPLQIVLAGKAHPNDDIGSAHIDAILSHIDQLNPHWDRIKVLILENYDTFFGKLLTNSVDIWLNNPLPPFEASGTSGMKAIANGVLQMTTLDGWVVEAEHDDIGWIFGYEHHGPEIGDERQLRLDEDSNALYETLEQSMKMYYAMNQKGKIDIYSPWVDKMINCVKRSAFFNTQRMIQQYKDLMWSS